MTLAWKVHDESAPHFKISRPPRPNITHLRLSRLQKQNPPAGHVMEDQLAGADGGTPSVSATYDYATRR